MKRFLHRRKSRGAAMIEAAVCLAVFTPILLLAVRLGFGVDQVHDLQDVLAEAAKLAGGCAPEARVRAFAVAKLPGLREADIAIELNRDVEPPMVRVTITNYRITRLQGAEPLEQTPSASFPYACE